MPKAVQDITTEEFMTTMGKVKHFLDNFEPTEENNAFVKDMFTKFPLGHAMWTNFSMLCDQEADQSIIQIARRDLDCTISMWLLTNEVALPGM